MGIDLALAELTQVVRNGSGDAWQLELMVTSFPVVGLTEGKEWC